MAQVYENAYPYVVVHCGSALGLLLLEPAIVHADTGPACRHFARSSGGQSMTELMLIDRIAAYPEFAASALPILGHYPVIILSAWV